MAQSEQECFREATAVVWAGWWWQGTERRHGRAAGSQDCGPLWEIRENGSRSSQGFSLGSWETVVPSLSQRIQQEIVSSKRGYPGGRVRHEAQEGGPG